LDNNNAAVTIDVDSMEQLIALFGAFDENLKAIEKETGANIVSRNTHIEITGRPEETELAKVVVDKLLTMIRKHEKLDLSKIRYAVSLAREGNADAIEEIMADVIAITKKGRQVKSRTLGQKRYVKAMRENTVVFAIGPAGTGKTYLAMAMAVVALKNKEVERIILTRPAVEAGENLGFLPGDLQNKVDPYLRPLYDALYEFLGGDMFARLSERGVIEVAPLAYMRGRTLSDAFIVLDEAQNCTEEQMKMFLTRFGENSRVVVTGDITQIDLPKEKKSGLVHCIDILKDVDDISVQYLTHKDVVRHTLVQSIIRAYERHEKPRSGGGARHEQHK
jgi:phosphate starvation-inducible PhoH-like protein